MTQLLVPSGFMFEPFDEELIMAYLIPMNTGRTLPCDMVRIINVYGPNSTPWEIFDDHKVQWIPSSECKNKKKCYAFTKLTKKGKGQKNFDRRAGCGTWDGQFKKSVLNCHGKVIGSKKYYNFKCHGFNYAKVYGHYGMHKYFVDGRCAEFVVCAITRDFSKIVEDPQRSLSLANTMFEINGDVDESLGQGDETSNGAHDDKVALQQVVTIQKDMTVDSVNALGNPTLMDQSNDFDNSTFINNQGFGNPNWFKAA